ncbi:MAG: hypothetical protein HKN21_15115 [Candidatus Eisenbacteria bacterium]|uniref:Paraquat-inducible protein A n=1 Tax=Eiseniibacteriota bacterium TaxID=2212470 RepID=A0A7Y2H3Q8_UNCEI|nr:hypothetical protein [Candidatus Eisenbacteria bacterium]
MAKALPLLILIAAFVFLFPGLTEPMITVTGNLDKADVVELGKVMLTEDSRIAESVVKMVSGFIDNLNIEGDVQVYDRSRSILSTVKDLFDSGNWFVGFLILLFSVIIPFTKATLLFVVLVIKDHVKQGRIMRFSNGISKWSMADVFVVAVFVAYLAAKATQNTDDIFALDAKFGLGFYCFTAYCLLSLLSAQLIKVSPAPAAKVKAKA